MSNTDSKAFTVLFKTAFEKCFGFALQKTLSETESKHFSNKIFDATGLVIGAKSLKNYSGYILSNEETKQENPSAATLDTLARYVLEAPYTDEVQRKEKEAHYPYWFRYKSTLADSLKEKSVIQPNRKYLFYVVVIIAILVSVFLLNEFFHSETSKSFTENFQSLNDDTLQQHGWFVQSKDETWWNRRNENLPGLTLFTLRGDNWPDSVNKPVIKNLLIRKIDADCFSTEIHLENFIPGADWQQAGILLMEDTSFSGKSIRLSIAYNDYFGGFNKPNEIIIQGLNSGGKDFTRPEEIAHIPLFTMEHNPDSLINNNMRYSALRIEKNNDHFRFLYSSSPLQNFAFKEAFTKELGIKPKYIGIFALQGFVNNTNYIPARISFFNLSVTDCGK